MAFERFELGDKSHIVVRCNGTLDVRGGKRAEVVVENGGQGTARRTESGLEVDAPGNCSLRVPEGSSVEVREALGDCRVRDLEGPLTGGSVNGTLTVRDVSRLELDTVIGDARVRTVTGPVQIGAVHGSLSLRDIAGDIAIGEVYGDMLARDLRGSIVVEDAQGTLALHADLAAGTESRFAVGGDAVFRLPAGASVRFSLPADAQLRLDRGLEAIEEGSIRIVTVGDGAASVHVAEATRIVIKQRSQLDDEASFTFSFAIGDQISEHLADLSAELESQFATLEADLANTISDRVRRQVERRLHNARRQVDAAQRHVEQEVERARYTAGATAYAAPGSAEAGSGPARDAATEEERLMILNMLEKGQITVQEAETLLAALEGK